MYGSMILSIFIVGCFFRPHGGKNNLQETEIAVK
jgi:hypothetical protein